MYSQYPALIFIILVSSLFPTRGVKYEFIADNDEVFDKCTEIPDSNGIQDLFDLAKLNLEFQEGLISVTGDTTIVWQDVRPSDRIEVIAEILKFQRGTWQPTTFSIRLLDFCNVQFDKNSMWYQTWSSHIPEDERKCINNYGHVYHYQPIQVNTVDDYVINMEGRHKIVVRISAFDELNTKRPKSICFEIVGEYFRYK